MDIAKTLDDLDALIGHAESAYRHARGLPHDALMTWNALPYTLDALVAEAEQLRLPSAKVRQQAQKLKHHLDALIGMKGDKGYLPEQHRSMALDALWRLRDDFRSVAVDVTHGPILKR
jgi:hypothetical protein